MDNFILDSEVIGDKFRVYYNLPKLETSNALEDNYYVDYLIGDFLDGFGGDMCVENLDGKIQVAINSEEIYELYKETLS